MSRPKYDAFSEMRFSVNKPNLASARIQEFPYCTVRADFHEGMWQRRTATKLYR